MAVSFSHPSGRWARRVTQKHITVAKHVAANLLNDPPSPSESIPGARQPARSSKASLLHRFTAREDPDHSKRRLRAALHDVLMLDACDFMLSCVTANFFFMPAGTACASIDSGARTTLPRHIRGRVPRRALGDRRLRDRSAGAEPPGFLHQGGLHQPLDGFPSCVARTAPVLRSTSWSLTA